MRTPLWTVVGVLLVGTMMVLSAAINFSFGFSLGTSLPSARIYGCVSVVAVIVMAILPLRISAHWAEGQGLTAGIGSAMFAVLALYALAGSIGFGLQNRSQVAGAKESLNAQLIERIAERDSVAGRIGALGSSPPPAALNAQLEAVQRDRRWDQTAGCTAVTAHASREYCAGIDRLRSQLVIAEEGARLRTMIEDLGTAIAALRTGGAGQIADPQSSGLAGLFGVEQDTVRLGLSVLLSLVVEAVSCFGLLVIVGSGAGAAKEEDTAPERVGRWLTGRVTADPSARITLHELEVDFRRWCEMGQAQAIGAWRFRRLLKAACEQIGLQMNGRTVVGLRLDNKITS